MATMNETFFEALLSPKAAKWSAGVAFDRSNPLPLDQWSVFRDLASATDYLSNAKAYPGQVIAYAEANGEMTVCVLSQNSDGSALTLKPVGTIPVGDDKTIEVSAEGAISLLGATGAANGTLPMIGDDGKLTWKTLEDIGAGDGNDNTTYEFKFENQKITITPKENGVATTPIELDLSSFITIDELGEVVGKAAEGETAATGIYKAIADALVEAKNYADENDDNDNTTYTLTYGDNEDASKKVIRLVDNANNVISEIDASVFIADGVLNNVEYDAENDKLIFTWNIVESIEGDKINYKTVEVDVKDLVDTYTNGDGLNLENNKFSVKIDSTSEPFLTVGADGVKLAGVQSAINTAAANAQSAAESTAAADATAKANQALTDAKADAANLYATKAYVGSFTTGEDDYKDLDTVVAYINKKAEETLKAAQGGSSETAASVALALQNYKNENDPKVKANTDKLATIAEGAQVNVIESVVANNGTAEGIPAAKLTATLTSKTVTLNDSALQADIAAALKAGSDAGTAASNAQASANANAQNIQTNTNAITNLQTLTGEHTTKITALEQANTTHAAEFTALSNTVQTHSTDIAGLKTSKADTTITDGLASRITANENSLKTLNETTIPAINEEIGKKANSENVYTKSEVNAITGTPTEGKTLVEMIAAAQEAATYDDSPVITLIGADTGKSARTIAAEEIAKQLVPENAAESLDTLQEIAAWIQSHPNDAAQMNAAIAAIYTPASGDVAASGVLVDEIARVEAKIHDIDNDTIKLNDNKAYIAKVSTDVLVQGSQELVFCAGDASGYHITH